MANNLHDKVARQIREAVPSAIKVLFDGAIDTKLSRTQRLKWMKPLIERADLAREFLTTAELQQFNASITSIAGDPATSISQQKQANRLLDLGGRFGLWAGKR